MAPTGETEDALVDTSSFTHFPQKRKHNHPGTTVHASCITVVQHLQRKEQHVVIVSKTHKFQLPLAPCSSITPHPAAANCAGKHKWVRGNKSMRITVEMKHDDVQLWQKVALGAASECRWWIRIFDNSQHMFSKSQCIWKCWHANISTQPLKQIGFYESPFYAIYYST